MENTNLINHYKRADKVMKIILSTLFVVSLALAPMYDTWMAALLIGGATLAAAFIVSSLSPGSSISRIVMGMALMVMTSLHIQQAHGMLEFHFGVFVLLALLLYYRDWVPVVAAAVTIAVHHLSFFFIQANGGGVWLLPSAENGFNIVLLHAVYVVVETAVVVWMSLDLKKEFLASSELSSTARNITRGDQIDLSIRTSGRTELLQDFDVYTESVNELVSRVASNSESVHITAEQLVTISNNLQTLSSTQQQQTDMIASAVEELTASASEVAANAGQAADAAEKAYQNSQACRQSSTTTENDILSLDNQIASAAETI
ncbi:methyl-accepting chemotaxis protein, partial [Oleiphilus sp. HI0080]|uniref:methyl-accepting chemotaxis protein n=1 Tax=Oleiphilus sp. HI0080 TaxID=1822255 RepID=UPI000B0D1AB7